MSNTVGKYNNGVAIYAFKFFELFCSFNVRKLEAPRDELNKYVTCQNMRFYMCTLFTRLLFAVFDDIIENGTQFRFSGTGWFSSYMCMQRITGKELEETRKRGAYKNFDVVETNFNAYRIEFCLTKKDGTTRRVPIHLDMKRSKRIIELAHANKLKAGRVKSYTDYYDDVLKICPVLTQHDVFRICKFGFDSFRRYIGYGTNITGSYPGGYFVTGAIYADEKKMYKYVFKQARLKAAVMYRRMHIIWDGYVYFSITRRKYDVLQGPIANHEKVNFGRMYVHKSKDVAFFAAYGGGVLLRMKTDIDTRRKSFFMNIDTDEYEVVEIFPQNWTWDLIRFENRKYEALLPVTSPFFSTYDRNYKLYARWLAARWRETHKD